MEKKTRVLIWVLASLLAVSLLSVSFLLFYKPFSGGREESGIVSESAQERNTSGEDSSLNEDSGSEEESGLKEAKPADVLNPLAEESPAAAAEMISANLVRIINVIGKSRIVGTGFFLENGYVVTNSHVVDIPGELTLIFPNGETAQATIFSNDLAVDIALLETENPGVKALPFGSTLTVHLTDPVYAAGYEFDFAGAPSINAGTLAARRAAAGKEYLQLDMSMNKGFSGGPLFNARGELLGINTYAAENASVGIAISAESLENIIDLLIRHPQVFYVTSVRPSNGLSLVLTEIGYGIEDLYAESGIIREYRVDHGLETAQSGDPAQDSGKEQESGDPAASDTRPSVPDFTHMYIRKAKTEAESIGLVPEFRYMTVPTKGFEGWTICDQSLQPETKVEKGTSITLYIPTNDDLVPVPDVRGLSYSEALAELDQAGITNDFDSIENFELYTFPKYFVSAPGAVPGTVVEFVFSVSDLSCYFPEVPENLANLGNFQLRITKGTEAAIPSLIGMSVKEARIILFGLPLEIDGFFGGDIKYQYHDTIPEGCIITYWTKPSGFEEIIYNPTVLTDRENHVEGIISLGPDPEKHIEDSMQEHELSVGA